MLEQHGPAPHILQLLLLPQLSALTLPGHAHSAAPLVLRLAGEHASHLTSLQLPGCRALHAPALAALLPAFSRLTSLDVDGTNFDDLCLDQVAEHASGLVSLSAARTRLSDAGLGAVRNRLAGMLHFVLPATRTRPGPLLQFLLSHPDLASLVCPGLDRVLELLAGGLAAGGWPGTNLGLKKISF